MSSADDDRRSEQSRMDVEQRRKQIYASMSAEQKWTIAADLYHSALALKEAHLQKTYPERSRREIKEMAHQWMMYAKT